MLFRFIRFMAVIVAGIMITACTTAPNGGDSNNDAAQSIDSSHGADGMMDGSIEMMPDQPDQLVGTDTQMILDSEPDAGQQNDTQPQDAKVDTSTDIAVDTAMDTTTDTSIDASKDIATDTTTTSTHGCPSDPSWAFCETFDGTPSTPTSFASSRFDIIVGENNHDGIVNGQTIGAGGTLSYGVIEAGYGPQCQAPHNATHIITVDDSSFLAFQENTRPKLHFICDNKLSTVIKSGYAIVSLMPRYYFDWKSRTGVIEFDANLYGFGRQWWDVYLMPEEDLLLETAHKDEGGTGEQYPKRAVLFSFNNAKPSVGLIDNYEIVDHFVHWQKFEEAFPADPAPNDPRILRKVRFRLSETKWTYEIEKADGTFWTFSQPWSKPLQFSRAFVKLQHHTYNPTKDGIVGTPWSQFTFSWDNFRFDGPSIEAHQAFEPPAHFINLMRPPDPNYTESVTIHVNAASIKNAVLVGHITSHLNIDGIDAANTSQWRQLRVNGSAWQNFYLVKPVAVGTSDRAWSTFRFPLTNVVKGPNKIEFRYPARPPQATWHWDGYRVKDLEIQISVP